MKEILDVPFEEENKTNDHSYANEAYSNFKYTLCYISAIAILTLLCDYYTLPDYLQLFILLIMACLFLIGLVSFITCWVTCISSILAKEKNNAEKWISFFGILGLTLLIGYYLNNNF